jgi:DivIVA domain-containing protein
MAAVRLDQPVLMSAEQIRRREFVTARRGYDTDQVRLYLAEVADQVEHMSSMIREARLEAESAFKGGAPTHPDPYDRLADRVASVIREADVTAERLRSDGAQEAERMLLEARRDADRIRTDAQAKAEQARAEAERALHEARSQADRTIAGLATRRATLVDQLAQMQERLLGVAQELEAAIEHPDDEPAPEASADAPAEAPSPWAPRRTEEVVDVTDANADHTGDEPHEPSAPQPQLIVADEILEGIDDPSYAELWEGSEALQLDMPEIPPLDLSWGDDDED